MVELPAQMTAPITVPSKGNSIQTTLLIATVMLWAAGVLCFIGFHLISYMRYKRRLFRTGAVIKDHRILCQLMQLKQELAIKRSVVPIASADAASPMMLGFFCAVIVLPDEEYSAEVPKQSGEKKELSTDTFAETEPSELKEKVTADADVPDNVREETPTLTFSLEGEEYEVLAVIAEGNGYTFYLPDGEWYPSDFESWEDIDEEWKACIYDAWTAWNNDDVRLWTVRLEGRV